MNEHSGMMDHGHHNMEDEGTPKEYAKFGGVILLILLVAYGITYIWVGLSVSNFLRMFMGTFFLVFSIFKLLDLKGFMMSYIGYDIVAKKFMSYGYIYPFIELLLALGYFFRIPYTEWITLIFMIIGSIGVLQELMRGSKIKCACLGTYIKLPLTTVSLVEDLTMGIMALLMILKIL